MALCIRRKKRIIVLAVLSVVVIAIIFSIMMPKIKSTNWSLGLLGNSANILDEPISADTPSCHYSNLSQFLKFPDIPTSPIPKLVHMVYKSTSVPEQYVALVKKCQRLNPDHHFIFWTDEAARKFIQDNYPKHLQMFLKDLTRHALELSDAIRYFVLAHFGGIYLDMDVECMKPFTSSMKVYRCVLDKESEAHSRILWNIPYSVMNSFMACQRNHPFFRQAINRIALSLKKNNNLLERTGPGFVTALHNEYNASALGKTRPVIVPSHTVFSPLIDPAKFDYFKSVCMSAAGNVGLKKEPCDILKKNKFTDGDLKEVTKNSIAIHRFLHIGYYPSLIKKRFNMCNISAVHVYGK